MHARYPYGWLVVLSLLGACAKTTTHVETDGQTHWMQRCDDSSDCGELSCICGVCTETCTEGAECMFGSDASCQPTSLALGENACEQAANVCAPPPDTITPVELSCDADGNLDGNGPFEIIASPRQQGQGLTIAPDGTILATFADGGPGLADNSVYRIADGMIVPFGKDLPFGGRDLWNVGLIAADASDLIATVSASATTILTIDLQTEARTILLRESARNVQTLAADEAAIYWIMMLFEDSDLGRSQLWRTPRAPGESVMLAELDGYFGELVTLDDNLFVLRSVDERVELLRISKEGTSTKTLALSTYAGSLRTDGQELFVALQERTTTGDGAASIARVDGATLELETLFDAGNVGAAELVVAADSPYVYWSTYPAIDAREPISKLWRGRRDGSGAPEELVATVRVPHALSLHDGELYWMSDCEVATTDGFDPVVMSHIVKRVD